MNMLKRLTALILAEMLLLTCMAVAEDEPDTQNEEAPADAAVTEKDCWHFTAEGFLTGDNPGDEYILEDEKEGVWQYASKDLSVRVTRYREQTKKKKKQEYCVAEIWASETSPPGRYPVRSQGQPETERRCLSGNRTALCGGPD